MGSAPWAILDFPGANGMPAREVFRDPVAIVEALTPSRVRPALDEVERLAGAGMTLVGFVAYDAAPGLEPKFNVRRGYEGPLVYFLACHPESSERPVSRSDAARSVGALGVTEPEAWRPDFAPDRYREKVAEIIEGIGRGDYYQVNLTERLSSRIGNPLAVYERIREAQAAPYSAYIETAEMAVMSISPELFLHRSGDAIESRPMKGTSARGRWPDEDDRFARALASSEKERAENVMIVDLVRNDMGRVAVPGSVTVPSLFEVERYPTVLQMTSYVRSQLTAGVTLADVFAALFPCGSVTGAPKIAASRSIASLEEKPRGVYCGAVGVVRPGARDFTFNVAIRTAFVDRRSGRAVYGAGGGITADSEADGELAELKAKAAVLTSVPRTVELLETLGLENGRPIRLDQHLARLAASAAYFGFPSIDASLERIRRDVADLAMESGRGLYRLRLTLRADGMHQVTVQPHRASPGARRTALCRTRVDSSDRRLFHKLTDRSQYDERLKEVAGVDDVILVNERGELTETTIGNLVLELEGRRFTPALGCGLLPGVYRQELLASGKVAEAILRPADLKRATRAWMVNSLRGWVECELV